MAMSYSFEIEAYAHFDLIAVGFVVFQAVKIQQVVVVAHQEDDISELQAHSAAKVDVEAVGGAVLGIIVIHLGSISIGTAHKPHGAVHRGFVGKTQLENGTGKGKDVPVVSEGEGIAEFNGQVEGKFTGSTHEKQIGFGTASTGTFAVSEEVGIEAGRYAEAFHQMDIVAGSNIETMVRSGFVKAAGFFGGKKITCSGKDLCMGLGSDEEEGGREHANDDFFHSTIV